MDHYRVILPFRTVGDQWCVLMPDGDDPAPTPTAWTVLTFDGPTPPASIAEAIQRRVAA